MRKSQKHEAILLLHKSSIVIFIINCLCDARDRVLKIKRIFKLLLYLKVGRRVNFGCANWCHQRVKKAISERDDVWWSRNDVPNDKRVVSFENKRYYREGKFFMCAFIMFF